MAREKCLSPVALHHKGQMELYLRWLDKHERKAGEDTPLGIILCAGKNSEQIELLERGHYEFFENKILIKRIVVLMAADPEPDNILTLSKSYCSVMVANIYCPDRSLFTEIQ